MDSLLRRITRNVAMALSDEAARQNVFQALQNSQIRERKLHFRTFLTGDGNRLAEGVDRKSSRNGDVASTLDSLIDLEFYMPVEDHRARWDGGRDLMVVSAMDDDGSEPHMFDLAGNPVPWHATPPETPTLAIVPAETNFSNPDHSAGEANALMQSDPGVYMVRADIDDADDYEPWHKGDPEFETHVFVRNPAGTFNDTQCAGEDQGIPFQYDHNDDSENPWDGNIALILEAGIGTNPVEFSVWENDGPDSTAAGPCTPGAGRPPEVDNGIIANYNSWGSRSMTAVSSEGGTTLIRIDNYAANMNLADNEWGDDDDEVGEVRPTACWLEEEGPVRFDLRSSETPHSTVGEVDLDFRFGERTPICQPPLTVSIDGPTSASPYSTVNLDADVSNYTAPLSYDWEKNGSPVCGNSSSCSSQIGAGGTYTTFEVTVTDADQDEDSDSHQVYAEFGGCSPCTGAEPDTTETRQ